MSAEESSIKDDLEKAFEQHEQAEARGPAENTQEPVRAAAEEPKQESGAAAAVAGEVKGLAESEGGRDEKGRFKGREGDPNAAKPPVEGAPKTDAQAPEGQAQAPADPLAAPTGWKAGAREQWAKIPLAAQEEIHRREKETAQTLRQSSQARQLANEFQQAVNPYMHFIQAQNSTPIRAVQNLMQTAAGLTAGSAIQKAQIVREIIQNYGIDINTLDQVLAGQPVQQQGNIQQQGQQAPPQWAQPIFQFMQGVQQTRQQRDQQLIQDAESETEAFAQKNEFFEDLREEMADRMEVAARRGKSMTLQQAYDSCVRDDAELSKIVGQREAAKKAQSNNIQRNRNAASSIAGAPRNGPTGAKGGDDSRRSAISEAWDEQNGR